MHEDVLVKFLRLLVALLLLALSGQLEAAFAAVQVATQVSGASVSSLNVTRVRGTWFASSSA